MDVLWFKLARRGEDDQAVLGRIEAGQMLVMLDRGDYWQCALIIRKGTADAVKAQGLDAFRARVAGLTGRSSAAEIESLDDVKLLTVTVDRLQTWYKPGLLCIGDAAHAMSPIGGVGINLAIQDAIAAANILAGPLREGRVRENDLRRVQKRRAFPTWATQRCRWRSEPRHRSGAAELYHAGGALDRAADAAADLPAAHPGAAHRRGLSPEHVDLKRHRCRSSSALASIQGTMSRLYFRDRCRR